MKLEIGKTYVVRNPNVVSPMGFPTTVKIISQLPKNNSDLSEWFKGNNEDFYDGFGINSIKGLETSFDLVKEVNETTIDLEYEKFIENRINEVDFYDTKGEYSHTEIRDRP